MKKYPILFLILVWLNLPAKAQNSKTHAFRFYNNNFFYDREYSNHIADGLTLPGNLAVAQIQYFISDQWSLQGGIYGLKYWGNNEKFLFKPLISIQFQNKNHFFRMGNLSTWKGRDNLPRPLYDEAFRYLAEALETGMEYRYQSPGFVFGSFLDWHRFIRKKDTVREILNFILHAEKDWFLGHEWHLRVPFTGMIHHRGGQINLKGPYQKGLNSILSVLSLSGGLEFRRKLNKRSDLVFFFDAMMHTMNSDNTEELKFKKGYAFWTGIRWYSAHWSWILSRWKAHRFNSPLGEDIFQTVSRRVDKYFDGQGNVIGHFANHTEPYRELWITGVAYKNSMTKQLDLNTKVEFFYQPYRSAFPGVSYLDDVVNHWDILLSLQLIYRL